MALLPLIDPITSATAYFGGIRMSMWTWSCTICPSRMVLPRCPASSRNTGPRKPRIGFELSGTRMLLKRLFNRLEHERDLGLLPPMARAAQLFLPVHQGQQHVFSPLGPPRCHRQLRQILPYRLPPQIDQG